MEDTIKIHIRLFSTLAQYGPDGSKEFTVDMPSTALVGSIPEALKMPASVQRVILVNGRHSKSQNILSGGDRVTIFPPMTGG